MNCRKKLLIAVISTVIITVILSGLSYEYYLQSSKYDDSVIITSIDSKIMEESREVIIHLPENYEQNTAKSYPVMYVLDGTSQDGHTFTKIDLLSKIEQFPEAIVVGIPNTSGNRSRDFTPHYMKIDLDETNSEKGNGHHFLGFMEKELIPFLNKNYRTNGFRTLSGNSRGGLFVMYALLEKPQLFDGYIAYSPAFWREDVLIAKKVKDFFTSKGLNEKFIFFSMGSLENEKMKNGFQSVRNILKNEFSKQQNGNMFHTQITENADHSSNSYESTIYALDKLNDFLSTN